MVLGNVVFPGKAQAVLFEYRRGYALTHPAILFVSALTTDVAFYIINNPVCGIISEESSFATHGANILRCFYKNRMENMVWVSGVRKSDLQLYFQKQVSISADGRIYVSDNTVVSYNERDSVIMTTDFVPLEKRSIVEYNASSKCYRVCFWPHRQFNMLTFSVMKSGLEENINLLFGVVPTATLDKQGRIWFSNAPLLRDIICLATDIEMSDHMLNCQFELYIELHRRINRNYSFADLVQMLKEYFSFFLLFHDTYEDVLLCAYSFFKEIVDAPKAFILMNRLMSCEIDRWMLENKLILEKKKNLLSNEAVVPLPDFSVLDDYNSSLDQMKLCFYESDVSELYEKHRSTIEHYVKFFVAKEWKFVTNKILFTRFSEKLRTRIPEFSFEHLSSMDIDFIINLMGAY